MKTSHVARLCMAALSATAAAVIISGCESGSDISPDAFRIKPAAHNLFEADPTLTLIAEGGKAPFTWRITDSTLGTLSGTNNSKHVTYTRNAKNGTQTVEVRDANTWTATAVIHQLKGTETEAITISPATAALASNGDKKVFTAAGGVPPYTWSVGIAARGSVAVDGYSQAVYTRLADGNNTVIVTDRQGHAALAEISQPAVAALSISPATATVAANGVRVFNAVGGVPPYAWTIQTAGSGVPSLNPATGVQTSYQAGATTNSTDVIRLTDNVGTIALATVTIP